MRVAKLAIVVALAAMGCSRSTEHAPQTLQVDIRGMQFVPASLQVHVGDHVVWTNRDLVAHTVTSAGTFDSGQVAPAATWSFTVTKSGALDYVCSLHPTMKGKLQAQ